MHIQTPSVLFALLAVFVESRSIGDGQALQPKEHALIDRALKASKSSSVSSTRATVQNSETGTTSSKLSTSSSFSVSSTNSTSSSSHVTTALNNLSTSTSSRTSSSSSSNTRKSSSVKNSATSKASSSTASPSLAAAVPNASLLSSKVVSTGSQSTKRASQSLSTTITNTTATATSISSLLSSFSSSKPVSNVSLVSSFSATSSSISVISSSAASPLAPTLSHVSGNASTITMTLSATTTPSSSPPSSTYPSTSSATPTSTYRFLGCYLDSFNARALPIQPWGYSGSTNTPLSCAQSCSYNNYEYSGTEYGQECWCGSTDPTQVVNSSDCDMPCSGDGSQLCGAGYRLLVYQNASLSSLIASSASSSTTGSTLSSTSTSTTFSSSSCSSLITVSTTSSSTKSASASTSSTPSSPAAATSTITRSQMTTTSNKRGLAYNDPSLTTLFGNASSQVTWQYNWGQNGCPFANPSLECIPMLWGLNSALTSTWNATVTAAIGANTTHLLGFNEPDYWAQSNIAPADAAAGWMEYMEPWAGVMELGGPAITDGGLSWLKEFYGNCTECTIDFQPVHWYDEAWNFGWFQEFLWQANAISGQTIWITEFQGWGTDAEQVMFMQNVLPFLDDSSWIGGYAYFGVFNDYLVNLNGTGNNTSGEMVLSGTGQMFDMYYSSDIPASFWG